MAARSLHGVDFSEEQAQDLLAVAPVQVAEVHLRVGRHGEVAGGVERSSNIMSRRVRILGNATLRPASPPRRRCHFRSVVREARAVRLLPPSTMLRLHWSRASRKKVSTVRCSRIARVVLTCCSSRFFSRRSCCSPPRPGSGPPDPSSCALHGLQLLPELPPRVLEHGLERVALLRQLRDGLGLAFLACTRAPSPRLHLPQQPLVHSARAASPPAPRHLLLEAQLVADALILQDFFSRRPGCSGCALVPRASPGSDPRTPSACAPSPRGTCAPDSCCSARAPPPCG